MKRYARKHKHESTAMRHRNHGGRYACCPLCKTLIPIFKGHFAQWHCFECEENVEAVVLPRFDEEEAWNRYCSDPTDPFSWLAVEEGLKDLLPCEHPPEFRDLHGPQHFRCRKCAEIYPMGSKARREFDHIMQRGMIPAELEAFLQSGIHQ